MAFIFYVFKLFICLFIYLFRESMSRGGEEREGETESHVEPDTRLELMNLQDHDPSQNQESNA